MKFRSGEGIACTGEDILILEKLGIYDFVVGELLLRKKKVLLESDVGFEKENDEQKVFWRVMQTTSVHDNGSHDDDQGQSRKTETRAIRRSSAPNRRKDQKAHSALSPVRSGVSKEMPQKRTLRLQKRDVPPEAENTTIASSTLQEKKPRGARKARLSAPSAHRVSKTAKNARAPKGNPAALT